MITQLKQENTELRAMVQQLKTILSQTKDYINDLEWQCKFSNDKISRMQATITELEALLAEKEEVLALGEAALKHLAAKEWLREHNYGEMVGYVDVYTQETTPDVVTLLELQDFLDTIADYALNAIEGGPGRE